MQENFTHLFNAIDEFLFIINEQGHILNTNSAALRALAFDKKELEGNSIYNIFSSVHAQTLSLLLKKFFEGDRLLSDIHVEKQQMVLIGKNGNHIHCLCSISVFDNEPNISFLISAVNITLQKETEEKLVRNLIQQTLLADISQTFLSLKDFEKKISGTIDIIGKHTGVSRVYIFEDSVDGNTTSNTYEWCNIGVEPQLDQLQGIPYEIIPSWKKILIEKGRVFSTNIQELPEDLVAILEPQGIKSILILPLYVENNFFGFIGFDECERNKIWQTDEIELLRTIAGILSNSFERRIYQKKLSDSEIRLKLAIDNTDTCLWDWNITTNELFLNEIWQKMTGYEAHEIAPDIIGWENTLHPEDKERVLSELNDHVNGKTDVYLSIYRIISKSGDSKWVIDKGRVVEFDANNKPSRAIGTIIDIDRQKKIEEELRNLNITKDKLFSIIAHDLRGLIGTIMQISEMVSDKNALTEENLNYFLQSQKELSQNTFQLLENLLSWARYNLEQIKYNPQKILLNNLIDESILGVKYKAIQKGIDIITDYNMDHYVTADEEMVKIITRNLLNNAIKFTKKGNIHIMLNDIGRSTEVVVQDTGVGISEQHLTIILSDHEYHSTTGTSNERGSGLGLKLCKSFINQNKGTFKVETTPGKGSRFIFTLPKA